MKNNSALHKVCWATLKRFWTEFLGSLRELKLMDSAFAPTFYAFAATTVDEERFVEDNGNSWNGT